MDEIRDVYVDVDDALRRIGGSMDLYKRLLNQFNEEDYLNLLEEALNIDFIEEAARLIHALKGVAANLSFIRLYKAAIEFEQNIKDGAADLSTGFAELKNTYNVTSQQIAKIL